MLICTDINITISMDKIINDFIKKSLAEDIGRGDITSQACIDKNALGKAELITKENCQIAGIDIAKKIKSFHKNNSKRRRKGIKT